MEITPLFAVTVVLQALIFGAIFHKAGYAAGVVTLLVLLMFIPVVTPVVLLWFALATWPLEKRYTARHESNEVDSTWELKMSLRRALTLEKRGQWDQAIAQLEQVIKKFGNTPNADLAREHIRQMRAKMGTPHNGSGGGENDA